MDQQQEKRYNNLRDMFNSEGWKEFQKDIEAQLTPRIDNAFVICQTNDQWQYLRGEVNILKQIEGYQAQVEFQQKLEEEEMDA